MITLTTDPQLAKSQLAASCDVVVEIECEKCGVRIESNHDNPRSAGREFYDTGWRVDKEGNPYCPDCVKEVSK